MACYGGTERVCEFVFALIAAMVLMVLATVVVFALVRKACNGTNIESPCFVICTLLSYAKEER